MKYYSFSTPRPIVFEVCGNLRSTNGFLHHRRCFDRWVFIYVKTGSLHLSQDGEDFTVGSGEYVFLPPYHEHFGTEPSKSLLSYFWVHFTLPEGIEVTTYPDLPTLDELGLSHFKADGAADRDTTPVGERTASAPDGENAGAADESAARDKEGVADESAARDLYLWPERGSTHYRGKIPQYFSELLDMTRQQPTYPAHMPACLLTLLLMQVSRETQESLVVQENDLPPILNKLTKWMRSNLDNDISMFYAAAEFNYSPDYLASLFRKYFHMSFTRCLNLMRIDAAKAMLVSQNCSIKEAAYSCGFPNEKYFMKVFREVVGMTPTAYKNTYFKYENM